MFFQRKNIAKKLLFVALAVVLMAAVVMQLWNWLLPALFVGVHAIGFAQALGLLVLCRILFGGFRGRGHHHGPMHRFARMTPEEKAQFRATMGARCHASPPTADAA